MRGANRVSLLVSLFLLLILLPANAEASETPIPSVATVPQWEKVDLDLRERLPNLSAEAPVEFVLRLADRADLAAAQFQRGEVVRRLRTVAADSQTDLLPFLLEAGFQVTASFWITNALLVQGPAGQVPVLTASPRVDRLHSNFRVEVLGSESISSEDVSKASLTWGLERVGAERVWSQLGVRGAGVRVCVSDTGVDVSHPDLAGKMWSDAPGDPQYPGGWIEFGSGGNLVSGSTPHDTHGHGTHTAGTVLGSDASGTAIGMAPEATLMHALVMPGGVGSFAQVSAGIEWCVDPFDDGGSPAGQPADVHSMSWGAQGFANELIDPLRNSYLAGTVPIAAAGNCGLGCSDTPGNSYDVLGVGASDVSDLIADFSSGEVVQKLSWSSPPADWPTDWTTPTVSAPGVNVFSSLPNGAYAEWSGTSMATPHVAGCVALMLSADPTLTPAAIREGLVTTAVWFDTYNPSPPDPRYGWGRIDCFAAAEGAGAVIVDFGLEVDPPVGLWSDTFRVQIKAMNVGNASGSYTAQLLVDDVPEGQQTVLLSPGETKVVAFDVSRDPVATYRVAIGSHSTSFRVRPPAVTVEARDVNGSAMPGAEVTVGLGASVLPMGVTDGNGTLAFDSPAGSHGQYWIVLQATDVGGPGIHYFLSQNLSIESDTLASFLPTPNSTATLGVAMEEVVTGQAGAVTLMRADMPPGSSDAYTYPPGTILVDRANHSAWAEMTVQTVQNMWSYRSASRLWDLGAAPSAAFPFGGPLTVALNWTQARGHATVDWNITDAYGNALMEVTQERGGILAGETIPHVPFLSLWNPQGVRLGGLYVAWDQKPVNVTLPDNETLAFVQVDLETGPYPFENTFVLMTEVLDSGGTPLPAVAATRNLSVEVRGTVLMAGRPLPIDLTVGGLPVPVEANGTFSEVVSLSEGLNTINITARDLAGNEESVVYVIHSKPRVFLSVESLPAIVNVSQIAVQGVVEVGAQLTVNGNAVQPDGQRAFAVTVPLSEGANTITVVAVDALGNREEVSQTVVLDTLPPDLRVTSPAPGFETRDDAIRVVGSTEATATLRINGAVVSLANGTFAYTVPLYDGANDIRLEVTDTAGNRRTMSLTVQREAVLLGLPGTDYWVMGLAVLAAASVGAYLLGRGRQRGVAPPTRRGELDRLAFAVQDLEAALQDGRRHGPPPPAEARPPRAWRERRR